jgi:hypothetical protein
MGSADLAAAKNGRLPWSFRDLHGAVHPLLPELSIEEMAQAYTNAYQNAPESTAAQLLLGMPLQPNTRLTRPQLWLLLVDGFAAPAQPRVAQLGGGAAPAAGGNYGTASLLLPQLSSPILAVSAEDWLYLTGILPLLAYEIPFDVHPLPAMGHEGHGGPGAVVALQARIDIGPRAVVSPTTGQLLLQPGNFLRDNRSIDWRVQNRGALERHGSFDVMPSVPVRTDHMGIARLSFTPKAESANGRGFVLAEGSSLTAAIRQWELVTTHYQLPPNLMGMLWGEREAPGALVVEWHEENAIKVRIENEYQAALDFGFLGSGARTGTDVAEGTLARQPDGSWEGLVDASVDMTQDIQSIGEPCQNGRFRGTQQLRVRATEVGGWTSTQSITYDRAASTGPEGGGFLALDFVPATAPRISPSGRCLDLIQRDAGTIRYLPLNDARWTVRHARYVIEMPESGTLVYRDKTTDTGVAGTSVLPSGPVHAVSNWKIRVEKPEPP